MTCNQELLLHELYEAKSQSIQHPSAAPTHPPIARSPGPHARPTGTRPSPRTGVPGETKKQPAWCLIEFDLKPEVSHLFHRTPKKTFHPSSRSLPLVSGTVVLGCAWKMWFKSKTGHPLNNVSNLPSMIVLTLLVIK